MTRALLSVQLPRPPHTSPRLAPALALLAAAGLVAACAGDGAASSASEATTEGPSSSDSAATSGSGSATGASATDTAATGDTTTDSTTGGPRDTAKVTHSFGAYQLAPFEEVSPCAQWTLHNDAPLYVNAVTLVNQGGWHHSNWLVVPEDLFPGADGYFDCDSRDFDEFAGAVAGTVLTAQSTQSRFETMQLPEGVIVKIPPRHKIIAGVHLLNLSNQAVESEFRMTLDLVHPRTVNVVTVPFRLTYYDLEIPAGRRSRFTGDCKLRGTYEVVSREDFTAKLYYVLPHFHYLGDYFSVGKLAADGTVDNFYEFDGFSADAVGRAFDPPIDFTGSEGVSFSCGYDNWTDAEVGWGIGDQEMCVMLGLADAALIMDASVGDGQNRIVDEQAGVLMNEGNCTMLPVKPKDAFGPPTQEEIDAELYLPPCPDGSCSIDGEGGLPPVDECVDADDLAVPDGPATLSSIRAAVFAPSCSYNACHFGANAKQGLDLAAADLHAELLGHTVVHDVGMPLVDPGNPDNSWLYRILSECNPPNRTGGTEPHMPLNAPTLLDDGLVAKVRVWIENGALDD